MPFRDQEDTLLNNIPGYVFVKDRRGAYIKVNRLMAEAFGRPVEEVLGKMDEELVPPEFARKYRADDALVFETGVPLYTEEIVPSPGRNVPVGTRKIPLRDQNGVIYALAGISFDLTERVRLEQQLRLSEERFRIAAQNASDLVWEWDPASDRLYFFGEIPRGTGEVRLPASTAEWKLLLHPADRERVVAGLERTLSSGAPFLEEYRLVVPDGGVQYWFNRATLLRDPSGAVRRVIGVATNVTESKRIERALRERASVLEASGDAIASFTLEGFVTTWNGGAERLTGYTPEEVRGKSVLEFVPAEHRAQVLRVVASVGAGETVRDYEDVVLRADGTRIPVLATVSPIRASSGQVIGLCAVVHDIRARRQAEEEIRRMNESLQHLSGQLLRSQDEERRRIARELHDGTAQTLVALFMNLGLMETACGDESRCRDLLKDTQRLAGQCLREVRSISYLLHPPLLDELGLVAALRSYVEGFSSRTGIRVDLDLPEETERLEPEVETALFRIVQEGLANVHRHSGSTWARLRLTLGRNVVLELRDGGMGLAAGGRLGVGIPGMRERARLLGGNLEISSSEQGTCLVVTLPASGTPRA